MAPPPAWTQQNNNANAQNKKKGLSLGSSVGIGIGVALLVILSAVGVWIFLRRRRTRLAKNHKAEGASLLEPREGDVEKKGRTEKPAEMEAGGDSEVKVVEIGGGEKGTAELGGHDMDKRGDGMEKRGHLQSAETVSDLYTGNNVHELPGARQEAVEIGEGKTFVAELDGTGVAHKK